jgi:hypothetical protein
MAPAFRTGQRRQRTVRQTVRSVASVGVGVAFCLMFGDLALRLAEVAL